ncbi:hypothetical protein ACFL5V_05935 [Fibrobacterota bacterium]
MSNLLHVILLFLRFPTWMKSIINPGPYASSKYVFFAVLSLGLCPVFGEIAHERAGTEEFPFLSTSSFARPAGLAGAHTTLAEGIDAIGSNPAGLAHKPKGKRVLTGFKKTFIDVNSGAISYQFPGMKDVWHALSVDFNHMGKISEIDAEGRESGKVIQPSNHTPSFSAAKELSQKVRAGVTAKLVTEYLGDIEYSQMAAGWALDFGIQIQPNSKRLAFGLAVINLGKKTVAHLEGGQKDGLLPVEVKGGMVFHSLSIPRARFALDLCAPYHNFPYLTGGFEYSLADSFVIRGGTRLNSSDLKNYFRDYVLSRSVEENTGTNALKLAAGFSLIKNIFSLDYAAQYWHWLGVVHWVTLKWEV